MTKKAPGNGEGRPRRPAERLAEAAEGIEEHLKKDSSIQIRVSRGEREEIKEAARSWNLTVTDYLLTLHRLVENRRKA